MDISRSTRDSLKVFASRMFLLTDYYQDVYEFRGWKGCLDGARDLPSRVWIVRPDWDQTANDSNRLEAKHHMCSYPILRGLWLLLLVRSVVAISTSSWSRPVSSIASGPHSEYRIQVSEHGNRTR
jgi:hypothetical protein